MSANLWRSPPLQDDWGLDWLIVVVIPEAVLMGPIYENVQYQVKEIVDTGFFAELQAKANNIRQRREQQQSRATPEKTG